MKHFMLSLALIAGCFLEARTPKNIHDLKKVEDFIIIKTVKRVPQDPEMNLLDLKNRGLVSLEGLQELVAQLNKPIHYIDLRGNNIPDASVRTIKGRYQIPMLQGVLSDKSRTRVPNIILNIERIAFDTTQPRAPQPARQFVPERDFVPGIIEGPAAENNIRNLIAQQGGVALQSFRAGNKSYKVLDLRNKGLTSIADIQAIDASTRAQADYIDLRGNNIKGMNLSKRWFKNNGFAKLKGYETGNRQTVWDGKITQAPQPARQLVPERDFVPGIIEDPVAENNIRNLIAQQGGIALQSFRAGNKLYSVLDLRNKGLTSITDIQAIDAQMRAKADYVDLRGNNLKNMNLSKRWFQQNGFTRLKGYEVNNASAMWD